MLTQLIPIDDVLYVFEAWILMVRSDIAKSLKTGTKVFLFDVDKNEIGMAIVNRFLPSKNPEISPVEIMLIDKPNNLKEVKFAMGIN